jgi:transcriptional regulator with XRE-family HTH domain
MMRWELLRAIKEQGLTQREFAKLVNEHESVISRIITGTWNPDARQRLQFAKTLKKAPEQLFPANGASIQSCGLGAEV